MQLFFIILKKVFLFFFLSLSLISCSFFQYTEEAKRNYKDGDYYEAILNLVEALKDKPDYSDAIKFIKLVYPKSIKSEEDDILKYKKSKEKFNWDKVVYHYKRVNKIQSEVNSLPELFDQKSKDKIFFEFKNYDQDYNFSLNNAAESHYLEGLILKEKKDDRDKQKRFINFPPTRHNDCEL